MLHRARPALLAAAASLLTGALLLVPTEARAQGNAARDPSAADALFQAAKEAMTRGDFATACPRFAESHRLDPAPGTLLNLASCEEKQGKLATAFAHVNEALETIPKDDYRLAYAREQAAALGKRVPKVIVKLAGGQTPAGTRVRRDGIELREGALGVALPVDPGSHVFVVEAPGRAPSRAEFVFTEGESKPIELHAGPPVTADDAGKSESGSGGGRRAATIASLAVGGAGLVTGIVTGLMFASAAKTYDDHCDATGCDQDGLDAASRAKTLDIVSPVAFAVGAIGIGTGTYLLLTGKKKEEPTRASVSAGARAFGSGAGLSLSGTF